MANPNLMDIRIRLDQVNGRLNTQCPQDLLAVVGALERAKGHLFRWGQSEQPQGKVLVPDFQVHMGRANNGH